MRFLLLIILLSVAARAETPDDGELREVLRLGNSLNELYPQEDAVYVTVGRTLDFFATYLITVRKAAVARLPLTDFSRLPPDYLDRPGGHDRMAGGKLARTKLDQELQERRRRGRQPLVTGALGDPAERLYQHFDAVLPTESILSTKTVVLLDADFNAESLRAVGDYFDLYRKARGRKFRIRQVYLRMKGAEPFPDGTPLALDSAADGNYEVDVIDLTLLPIIGAKLANGRYDRYAVIGNWHVDRDSPGMNRTPAVSLNDAWIEALQSWFPTCDRPLRRLGAETP